MKRPDCVACKEEKTALNGNFNIMDCNVCERIKKYSNYLEKRRKFKKGSNILTFDELLRQDRIGYTSLGAQSI